MYPRRLKQRHVHGSSLQISERISLDVSLCACFDVLVFLCFWFLSLIQFVFLISLFQSCLLTNHLQDFRLNKMQPAAMTEKTLRITSANGDKRMVSVVDTTTVREILRQLQADDDQDRQATLLKGVMLLEPAMTVSKAGLEDGDEISLVWSQARFVEMASWTGREKSKDLYVRIPARIRSIEAWAFSDCNALVKVVIHNLVTWLCELLVINMVS